MKFQPKEGRASDRLLVAMVSWKEGRRDDARTWYIRAIDWIARNPHEDPDAAKFLAEARSMLMPVLLADRLLVDSDR